LGKSPEPEWGYPELASPPLVRPGRNRIPVSLILGYLAAGSTFDEILSEFPDLTREQIADCLNYARDLSEFEVAV
jgi:uncharacterized protein (DUF433 family)